MCVRKKASKILVSKQVTQLQRQVGSQQCDRAFGMKRFGSVPVCSRRVGVGRRRVSARMLKHASLASLWSRWEQENEVEHLDILLGQDATGGFCWRRHKTGDLSGQLAGFELGLPREEQKIHAMLQRIQSHPMAVFERVFKDERKQATVGDHLSPFNIALTTNFNAFVTIGYSKCDTHTKLKKTGAHLWVAEFESRDQPMLSISI